MSGDSSFMLKDSDPLLDPGAFQTSVGRSSGSKPCQKDAQYGGSGVGEKDREKKPTSSTAPTHSLEKKIAYALGATAIIGLVTMACLSSTHRAPYSNNGLELKGVANIGDMNRGEGIDLFYKC